MKVVGYVRVSSEEQAERGTSIAAQRKAIQRWAESEGVELLQIFADEGVSAYAPADRRPGFGEMITFCKKATVEHIVVHKLDRFSRNQEESIIFKSLLRRKGVTVKSLTESYDPDTPSGFLYEGMIEVINQFYSLNLAQETLKGMRENAERGFLNGGRIPYGYRQEMVDDGGRKRGRLTPGPPLEVQVVQDLFRLSVEEGMGLKVLANRLNRAEIPSPTGRLWSPSTIGVILRNPAYAGDQVWLKRRAVGKGQRSVNSAPVIAPDTHEALVSRELWDRRQEMAKSRSFHRPSSRTKAVTHLLGRLIQCGHCQGSYVGRRQKYKDSKTGQSLYRRHYYCHTYLQRGKDTCPASGINADWLEGIVVEQLRQSLGSPEALKGMEMALRSRMAEHRRALNTGRGLTAQIRTLDAQIHRYWKAIGEGMDIEIAKGFIEKAESEKSDLEAQSELATDEASQEKALADATKRLREIGLAFGSLWAGMTEGAQRQAILATVEKLIVLPSREVRIFLKVPRNGRLLYPGEHKTDTEKMLDLQSPSLTEGPETSELVVQIPEQRSRKSSSKRRIMKRRDRRHDLLGRRERFRDLFGRARRFKDQIDSQSLLRSDIAAQENLSRARVTQIMAFLNIIPEIRDDLTGESEAPCPLEREVRYWCGLSAEEQMEAWREWKESNSTNEDES